MIKAVIFDMDDTLYSEHQFVLSGFEAVDRHIIQQYGVKGFYQVATQLFESGNRGQIFNESLESLSIPYDSSTIHTLLTVYRNHVPNIKLFDDADWALSYYAKRCKTGLITDGYLNVQKSKVKALAIEPMLDFIVYSDEYGRDNWKPSPTPYLQMMVQMGFEGSEYVYVGDNLSKDFITAKKLGWLTVFIRRNKAEYLNVDVSSEYLADYTIKSLYDLKSILNIRLLQGSKPY